MTENRDLFGNKCFYFEHKMCIFPIFILFSLFYHFSIWFSLLSNTLFTVHFCKSISIYIPNPSFPTIHDKAFRNSILASRAIIGRNAIEIHNWEENDRRPQEKRREESISRSISHLQAALPRQGPNGKRQNRLRKNTCLRPPHHPKIESITRILEKPSGQIFNSPTHARTRPPSPRLNQLFTIYRWARFQGGRRIRKVLHLNPKINHFPRNRHHRGHSGKADRSALEGRSENERNAGALSGRGRRDAEAGLSGGHWKDL